MLDFIESPSDGCLFLRAQVASREPLPLAIGRRPDVMLEVDGLNAILNLVKEGMGHAVLPSYTLSNFDNPETFTVQAIHSPRIMSQLMLVWSSRRPTTQTQRKAMDVVNQVVLKAIHR